MLKIFKSLDDILPLHEDSRDVQRFFLAFSSNARVSFYFTSALITVHLTPREKPMKTEAPRRRRGNEDHFTAHDVRRWTSGKKIGRTTQLPLARAVRRYLNDSLPFLALLRLPEERELVFSIDRKKSASDVHCACRNKRIGNCFHS